MGTVWVGGWVVNGTDLHWMAPRRRSGLICRPRALGPASLSIPPHSSRQQRPRLAVSRPAPPRPTAAECFGLVLRARTLRQTTWATCAASWDSPHRRAPGHAVVCDCHRRTSEACVLVGGGNVTEHIRANDMSTFLSARNRKQRARVPAPRDSPRGALVEQLVKHKRRFAFLAW